MMRWLIFRLGADRRGSSALETALLIPMMSFALFAVFDIAMGFSAKLKLVQVAARTAELATAPGTVGTDYSYLTADAAAASGQPTSNIAVDFWLECNAVRQSSTANICGAGQQFARYISVTIRGTYNASFGFGPAIGISSIPIAGSATVRLQ